MRLISDPQAEESFWPAYVDVLMVTSLVMVLLATTFAIMRKDDRLPQELQRRKQLFSNDFNRVMATEVRQGKVKLESPEGEHQSITFSDQLLFDAGSANLNKALGRASLEKLARLLQARNPRHLPLFKQLQINGHTDEDPIRTAEFPSNWHLSSARATSVLFFMVGKGLDPSRLSATGFAEHRPYTPSDKALPSKASKRRIELVLQYPLDWLGKELAKKHLPQANLAALPEPAASPRAHPTAGRRAWRRRALH